MGSGVLGLSWIDLALIGLYLVGMIVLGIRGGGRSTSTDDYFLAGRSLGRWMQFFLNFGQKTDANGAASVSSEVFRQGASGMWIGFQSLFFTPLYWFTAVWFRRVRLVTMADLFADRFGSRRLAALYAVAALVSTVLAMAVGNVAAYKVSSAIMAKPAAQLTVEETERVAQFERYRQLTEDATQPDFTAEQTAELSRLQDRVDRREISGTVSYIQPHWFYLVYSVVIVAYVVVGGYRAAALTDAAQGLLLVIFSLMLIPLGLYQLGGLSGMHDRLPDAMVQLFGTAATSEYAWYTVAAIVVTSLITTLGLPVNMAAAGSARTELDARIGATSGAFAKRIMMIAWMYGGLLAYALLSDRLADPDFAWGALSLELLPVGLIGLLLAGLLAGNMSTIDAGAVNTSALFVRNLYQPVRPARWEKGDVTVGQIATVVVIGLAVLIALRVGQIIPLIVTLITLLTAFGVAVILVFLWRRLTAAAVAITVVVWLLAMGAVPWVLPMAEPIRTASALTLTEAPPSGQAIFFDRVAAIDPADPDSPREGLGRFHAELYLLDRIGLPVAESSASVRTFLRWAFAGVVPFILMIGLSWVTPATDPARLDRFYRKLRTPVHPDPEVDAARVRSADHGEEAGTQPRLFRAGAWEFRRWDRLDALGFAASWAVVGLVLGLLWLILSLGRA
jgi:Na+/proline symporter